MKLSAVITLQIHWMKSNTGMDACLIVKGKDACVIVKGKDACAIVSLRFLWRSWKLDEFAILEKIIKKKIK